MVDGGDVQRVEYAVWGICAWGRGLVGGVESAVCGLCGVAAEVDGRRDTAGTSGVLEAHTGGSPGSAGYTHGLCAAGGKGLCRSLYRTRVGCKVDGGVEGVEPAVRDDDVHDVTGRVGGVAGAAVGAAGCGSWNTGGESWAER